MNYEDQCVASVQDRDGTYGRCGRSSAERPDATVPLCHQHYRAAFRQIAAPIARKLERERKRAARHHCNADQAVQEYIAEQADIRLASAARYKEQAVAYFIRCGQFVKIGASLDPVLRLNTIRRTGGVLAPAGLDLRAAELIVTEPGGFEREHRLHIKFAHLRHTGEWFTEAPDLTSYIESKKKAADVPASAA